MTTVTSELTVDGWQLTVGGKTQKRPETGTLMGTNFRPAPQLRDLQICRYSNLQIVVVAYPFFGSSSLKNWSSCGRITIRVRRLVALPSGVSLEAIG
jgi:hypothetical protein